MFNIKPLWETKGNLLPTIVVTSVHIPLKSFSRTPPPIPQHSGVLQPYITTCFSTHQSPPATCHRKSLNTAESSPMDMYLSAQNLRSHAQALHAVRFHLPPGRRGVHYIQRRWAASPPIAPSSTLCIQNLFVFVTSTEVHRSKLVHRGLCRREEQRERGREGERERGSGRSCGRLFHQRLDSRSTQHNSRRTACCPIPLRFAPLRSRGRRSCAVSSPHSLESDSGKGSNRGRGRGRGRGKDAPVLNEWTRS